MQDLIEGDDIPLRRLFVITLHAAAMLLFTPRSPFNNRPGAIE